MSLAVIAVLPAVILTALLAVTSAKPFIMLSIKSPSNNYPSLISDGKPNEALNKELIYSF